MKIASLLCLVIYYSFSFFLCNLSIYLWCKIYIYNDKKHMHSLNTSRSSGKCNFTKKTLPRLTNRISSNNLFTTHTFKSIHSIIGALQILWIFIIIFMFLVLYILARVVVFVCCWMCVERVWTLCAYTWTLRGRRSMTSRRTSSAVTRWTSRGNTSHPNEALL